MSASWPSVATAFFTELEQHNDRAWWRANRGTYADVIAPAFTGLLGSVDAFGPWRVHRPHNDTRFNPEKEPYKTFIGAVAERDDGVGAFVQISSRGLLVATGLPMPAPDQLGRLRSAIADVRSGDAFVAAVAAVTDDGARVSAGRWEPLKRVPRGFPADHPRADFLRWKGVEISRRPGSPAWLDGADAAVRIDGLLAGGRPLHDWLARHVGLSALTPEERFAPRRRGAERPATGD